VSPLLTDSNWHRTHDGSHGDGKVQPLQRDSAPARRRATHHVPGEVEDLGQAPGVLSGQLDLTNKHIHSHTVYIMKDKDYMYQDSFRVCMPCGTCHHQELSLQLALSLPATPPRLKRLNSSTNFLLVCAGNISLTSAVPPRLSRSAGGRVSREWRERGSWKGRETERE